MTENLSRNPITEACLRLLNRKVPNDSLGKTYADLLVEALYRRAFEGHVPAFKELMRIEERALELQHRGSPIANIFDKRERSSIPLSDMVS